MKSARARASLRHLFLGVGGAGFVVALALTAGRPARGAMATAPDEGTQDGATTPRARESGDIEAPGEAHLELGQSLLPLGDLLRHHQDVVLNGQHVSFATSVVAEPVAAVLDRVERGCNRASAAPSNGAPQGYTLSSVHREETGGIGAVLCTPASSDLFARAARAILEEGSTPAEWPAVHYTYAQPTKSGETLVYSVWSEQPIDFDRLYGSGAAEGDTRGSDPPGGARPLDSRRLLSAAANGSDYTARVYETTHSVDLVTRDYDARMTAAGWTSSPAVAAQVRNARLYTGHGRDLAVEFQPQERGTLIAMAEMPAAD